jgi:hypothetical protein
MRSLWIDFARRFLSRQSAERLEWFFQTNGGISGSARKYAVNQKTARQKNEDRK